MYKWTLKYRNTNEANVLDPEGFSVWYLNNTLKVSNLCDVNPSTTYQGHGTGSPLFSIVAYYDLLKNSISIDTNVTQFTTPAGCYYVAVVIDGGEDLDLVGITEGASSSFVSYYLERELMPIYKKASRGYKLESNQQYYRDKLDGNIILTRGDYDFVDGVVFDERLLIELEDLDGVLPLYKGVFYKTDCKWDADNKRVEIKIEPNDDYEYVIGGMSKMYNVVDLKPELEEITVRKRPIIQVYIAGDTILTNIVGGTYWEQELQIDAEFSDTELTNTYHFFNSKNIRYIQTAYSGDLSTDVTGEYDDNRRRLDGAYDIIEETDGSPFFGTTIRRYTIQRVSDSADLYQTAWTDGWIKNLNGLIFSGINGETGQFYCSEYRIYVRYLTDLLDVRGTSSYPVPDTDIVMNNANYKRVIGYDIDDFYIYEATQVEPSEFGRLPDGTPNEGEYYKEYLVSVTSGLSNPLPVAMSQWRGVSLWFFNNTDIRYTEFVDGQDFILRDNYPLHSMISILLGKIGSKVTHTNTSEYSEILYGAVNPLGGFTYLDFNGGTLLSDYASNVKHFITPKTNILVNNYSQAAQKAELSLEMVLNMLRDVYGIYWYLDAGKLKLEHIKWFQNGGSYSAEIIGTDLTVLTQIRNMKKWGFAQNKWSFDKTNMAERYEFGWMDDVSKSFEGFNIDILSNYMQRGRVENKNINGFSSDIDFMMANPSEISKDGFALISTVDVNGVERVPFIEFNIGYNSEVIMQNGFLSWLYLHQKYHVYDLPSDSVRLNGEEVVLSDNKTRFKKQSVVFPVTAGIEPYKLIKSELGVGVIDNIDIDLSSNIAKATIKHDTE